MRLCWRQYGRGRWRKRKGIARVQLTDGTVRVAEIHWYEALRRLILRPRASLD